MYVTTGLFHLIAVCVFSSAGGTLCLFNFKTKYGSCMGCSLFINSIIQLLMAITLIINQFHPDFSMNFVFEALGLFQQLSFYLIMFFIGGVYNKQKYDNHIKKIIGSIVCINKIILFQFNISCVNLYDVQIEYKKIHITYTDIFGRNLHYFPHHIIPVIIPTLTTCTLWRFLWINIMVWSIIVLYSI